MKEEDLFVSLKLFTTMKVNISISCNNEHLQVCRKLRTVQRNIIPEYAGYINILLPEESSIKFLGKVGNSEHTESHLRRRSFSLNSYLTSSMSQSVEPETDLSTEISFSSQQNHILHQFGPFLSQQPLFLNACCYYRPMYNFSSKWPVTYSFLNESWCLIHYKYSCFQESQVFQLDNYNTPFKSLGPC